MVTRKQLLVMLKDITREDQPVLSRSDEYHWGSITLWPKHDEVVMGKSITLAWVNMSLAGGDFKFGTNWIKYNQWLHKWYLGKSLGPKSENKNEHRTQLRAAGYSEEQMEKTMEELGIDRERYLEFLNRGNDLRGGDSMDSKDDATKTEPSQESQWNELNRAAVMLNKWTQRTMYTLQTSSPKADLDLEKLTAMLQQATASVSIVCKFLDE